MNRVEQHFLIVFGLLALAFGAGLVQFYWRRLRRNRAIHWPLAEGRVEVADVGERAWWDLTIGFQGRSPRNIVALGYSYSLAGIIYSGIYKRAFEDEDEAWAFARKFKGCAVSVQYNPEKVCQSLLFEESLDSLQLIQPSIASLASPSPRQSHVGTRQAPAPASIQQNPRSVWRIASWIVLAIAVLELWRFEEALKSQSLGRLQSRTWLVLAIITFAASRVLGLISTASQRK
jgi:hypothetical protein